MGIRTGEERVVSLFRNGRSQAVRTPKEFEIASDRVIIARQEDGSLLLRPAVPKMSLIETLDWMKTLEPIDDLPGDPGDDDLPRLDDVVLWLDTSSTRTSSPMSSGMPGDGWIWRCGRARMKRSEPA